MSPTPESGGLVFPIRAGNIARRPGRTNHMAARSSRRVLRISSVLLIAAAAASTPLSAQAFRSASAPMISGDSAATSQGWSAESLVAATESVATYVLPGVIDGLSALRLERRPGIVRVYANHELESTAGYPYMLRNGTVLTGARVTAINVRRRSRRVGRMSIAYRRVVDRRGRIVRDAAQLNENGLAGAGLARFCSNQLVAGGRFGLRDTTLFVAEEAVEPGQHIYGGSVWALDTRRRILYAVPAMGRGSWENLTPLATGSAGHVAFLLGQDRPSAPLFLYIGEKDARGDGRFLDRNGLAEGRLFVWTADNGDRTPNDFGAQGDSRAGTFVPIDVRDPASAGDEGYDARGYSNGRTLVVAAGSAGAFFFAKPEDVHTNPADPTEALLVSAGNGATYPLERWGGLFRVSVAFDSLTAPTALVGVIADADSLDVPQNGLRNPDNVVWADDGYIYAQEDPAVMPTSDFGAANGIEPSIWRIDPDTAEMLRIAEVDRSAVFPPDASDSAPTGIGLWESTGIIDVTALFPTAAGATLLMGSVQAHTVKNGSVGGSEGAVESAQIFFLRSAAAAD